MSKATRVVVDGASYPLDDTTAVDFSEAQSLSTAEKQQARTNIGAGSAADVTSIQTAIGTVPAGSNLQGEVDDLKSAFSNHEELFKDIVGCSTKNCIDQNDLTNHSGITKNGVEFYGKISDISGIFLPLYGIKPNTRYTLSFECYNETRGTTEGSGLIAYLRYSDESSPSGAYCANSISSYTSKSVTSAANKTVVAMNFYGGTVASYPNDIWHIKNIQLEEGTTKTAYEAFELTAVDSMARDQIANVNTQIRADFANIVIYVPGKNIFNGYDANHVDGVLINTSGVLSTNSSYNSVFLPVEAGKTIVCNYAYVYFSFYNEYSDISALSAGATIPGNTGGAAPSSIGQNITVPTNTKYMCVSYQPARKDTLQVEYGTTVTTYEKYTEGIPGADIFPIKPIVYDIKADGSGDYANLRACLEAITDATERKPYEVHIHEGTYDIASLFTAEEISQQSNNGLFVPNYVTLVGVGRRDNIILSCVLSEYSTYFSPIHFRNYGGMKNLTITATKCRYTVHDDIAVNGIGGNRIIDNCVVIGNDLNFGCVYGSGLKENCHWEIINTIMDGTNAAKGGGQGLVFLSHNQLGWTMPSDITFKNCRFRNGAQEGVNPTWGYAMRFRSLITDGTTTWNNMPVYVHFSGCHCDGIELGEDGTYGSGIVYWVDGFSNENAWEHVTSTTTPPVTVAERFNLIGSYDAE